MSVNREDDYIDTRLLLGLNDTQSVYYAVQRAIEMRRQAEDTASRFISRANSVDDLLRQIDALTEQVRYIRYIAEKEKRELERKLNAAKGASHG